MTPVEVDNAARTRLRDIAFFMIGALAFRLAFLAAMPFDAAGPYYRQQVEVWIYDLATDELHQITEDDVAQYSLVWK